MDETLKDQTNPEEVTETTAQTEAEQKQDTTPEEPKHKVKYNGEEIELSVSDLITNAQKGMNYDHVHEDLENTRKTSATAKAELDALTAALNQYGYDGSAQEIADMLTAQQRETTPDEVRKEREQEETKQQENQKFMDEL
ncbi:hypothetical protein MHBO_004096, partial [Bonamia ostreae]